MSSNIHLWILPISLHVFSDDKKPSAKKSFDEMHPVGKRAWSLYLGPIPEDSDSV